MSAALRLPFNRHLNANPRFGGIWAKTEIFLGLTANGIGLFLGVWLLARPASEFDWGMVAGALMLYVLGGYLAMAGHRSHLYRSDNELAEHLRDEISRLEGKVNTQ